MKIADLIRIYNPLDVEYQQLKLYPESEHPIFSFRELYKKLRTLKPEESSTKIHLSNTNPVEVFGVDFDEEGNEIYLSLEYSPWSVWLGAEITEDSLAHFHDFDILIHCLIEMTKHGFDEESIHQALLKMIEERNDT